ncbi:MAG: PQQ-dependent dehydrogenase, methanol/ethanol family [Candidatus Acidiferrales bacterium]
MIQTRSTPHAIFGFSASLLVLALCAGCGGSGSRKAEVSQPADVDAARLATAAQDSANWMTYGRTYSEQRFSPLKDINDRNVAQLALAWHYDLDTRRGQEATPIVVDGVMYFTSAWSKVFALDAATGAPLWTYDPKVPPEWGVNACCDVVNRGVAVWRGKVFVGTLDGRLLALDAATGKRVWETRTFDPSLRHSITGAPRVVKGNVIIGNGGAEMGVRGFVSAYNADTGNLVWRFFTVPGDPSKPFESPILAKAAKTWSGEWWKNGGGATVWDAIVYDPELDLLYIGTGNGDPWAEKYRNPKRGDGLFTCSIVALKPETGEYVWHYQEVPADDWDYDSAEQMILADIPIEGQSRKVLLHAPKNGIFYVLDRATGALISAKSYTNVTWTSGIDMKSGRPIINPDARYSRSNKPALVTPGPLGAHSWHPISYSPVTGLVYIPVQEAGFFYKSAATFDRKSLTFNNGVDLAAAGMPQDPKVKKDILSTITGRLIAWDPVLQKVVWEVKRPKPGSGGVLSTAGNLVFEGTSDGHFEAYRADSGEKVWSMDAQSGVVAGPVTYSVKGEQYIAVLAGWGGVFPLAAGEIAFKVAGRRLNVGRMLAFKLGGKATLPPGPDAPMPPLNPPKSTAAPAAIKKGEAIYARYCGRCHGDAAVSGGILPDLRYSSALADDHWIQIVMGGLLEANGMVSFSKELSKGDAEAVRAYVILRANQSVAEERAAKAAR